MPEIVCNFEPYHTHTYPDDWTFGGAEGKHPGADERWEPLRYYYFDDRFNLVWVTSVPCCDDEALDYFTFVANLGKGFNPVYISKRPEADSTPLMLPFKYDKTTDVVEEIVRDSGNQEK